MRPGLSLIAEFKRRSPSAGELRPDAGVAETVRGIRARRRGRALDPDRGAPVRWVPARPPGRAEASYLPILRKDFVVDPYQLYEAAANGADAVLLIVAALQDRDLADLYDQARGLDLDCLVEVHDEPDLERALSVGADVIGINNRNLAT